MIDYIFVLFSCWSSENRVLYMDNALVGLICPSFALCAICLREWGTDTNSTLKETQGICEGLLRFKKWCDIISLTNLNLSGGSTADSACL